MSLSSPHLSPSTRTLNTDHPSISNMSDITETVPEPINSGGPPSAPPAPAVTPSEPSPTVETSVFLPGNVSVPMGQPNHLPSPSPELSTYPVSRLVRVVTQKTFLTLRSTPRRPRSGLRTRPPRGGSRPIRS